MLCNKPAQVYKQNLLNQFILTCGFIYKIFLMTFKILHGLSPKYLSDLISIQQPSSYNLRRNDNGRLLERPSAKTKKTMGDRAFQVAAPFLWNKLPRSAREATNLESFKTLIKTFLFKESFQLS